MLLFLDRSTHHCCSHVDAYCLPDAWQPVVLSFIQNGRKPVLTFLIKIELNFLTVISLSKNMHRKPTVDGSRCRAHRTPWTKCLVEGSTDCAFTGWKFQVSCEFRSFIVHRNQMETCEWKGVKQATPVEASVRQNDRNFQITMLIVSS